MEVGNVLKKWGIALALAAFLTLAGVAPGFAASVMERGVVVIGTEGTYPPFEFYDSDNNLTGFDVEMAQAVCKRLGKEAKFVDMAFDGLIPALLSEKIDLVAAAMNATAERRQRVDFSQVYHITDAAVITKTDNDTLKDFADLDGKVIGVQLGTVEDQYLTGLGSSVEVKRYQKVDDAVREVMLGRNDGAFLDTVVGLSYMENEKFTGSLKVAFKRTINGPEEGFCLGTRKDDPRFLDAVNAALKEMEQSGELQALRKKYRLE
jgi:polar amino acid transport system substrate-binding protein